MPRSLSINTRIARAAAQKHPDLPSRTLARSLMAANPGAWPTLEAARSSVIRIRGRNAYNLRRSPSFAAHTVPSTAPRIPWNPTAYLPASEEKPFLPHQVTVDRDTRALVLSDIHLPYHNLAALTTAIEHGRTRDCRLVLLNGDTLDFHRLSRFQKDPRARSFKQEIAAANQLLDALDDLFPTARKIWKDGNHDERYDHYMASVAPEITEVVQQHAGLSQLLDLPGRGWEYVSEKRPIYLGKLPVIHGHEYPTPVLGPVNAARGLFLRTKESALVSHHHQTSEHTETTIREKIITAWSIGCLCDLHPMYARFNKWNHGFAEIELAKNGDYRVQNKRIHEGAILN